MARLRTWAEWDEAGLSDAERQLAACCQAGEACVLGDGTCPDEKTPEREIRADFLRYLILGGCTDCQIAEWGVDVRGAYISGRLDLDFCRARGATVLINCRFERAVSAIQARFDLLGLNGSAIPRLNAQGAEVTGGVFLRGATTEGEVSLVGARIGGQLSCVGAKLSNANGDALNAQRLQVGESLFWQDVTVSQGYVNFASAHVGDLVDDMESWPEGGRVYLDGFTYDRIAGSFTDATRRLDWLRRVTVWEGEFFPQPYTQLAHVLRGMGHDRDARRVLMARERLIRRYMGQRVQVVPNGDWDVAWRSLRVDFLNAIRWLWSLILRRVTGYGHAPGRSLWALAVLWVIAVCLAGWCWEEGSFAPNDGPVLVSSGWQGYVARDCMARTGAVLCEHNPAAAWSSRDAPGEDWDSFNRYGYAADVVVPILDLGQTDAWAPSAERGLWGWTLWWGRWVLATLGWIVSGLGAAAIAGVFRRE